MCIRDSDYTTPPYLGTGDFHYTSTSGIDTVFTANNDANQNTKHYLGQADMIKMFMGFTLTDDSDTSSDQDLKALHSTGGELIQTAGLGMGGTGGHVVVMGGYGVSTTSGSVTVKTLNAGHSGVSGALAFSSGTTSSGNSGLITLGTGAATSGKGGMISVKVGSGDTQIGGNAYMVAGQTTANNKDGGHVAIVGGTGGQASAGTHGARTQPGGGERKVSKQYFMTDANCKSHEGFAESGDGHDCTSADQRERASVNGPWWDDYSSPAYPGTHAQPGSHVHGTYDESADMIDMFAGHTLSDDTSVTHSSGGEVVICLLYTSPSPRDS